MLFDLILKSFPIINSSIMLESIFKSNLSVQNFIFEIFLGINKVFNSIVPDSCIRLIFDVPSFVDGGISGLNSWSSSVIDILTSCDPVLNDCFSSVNFLSGWNLFFNFLSGWKLFFNFLSGWKLFFNFLSSWN